MILVEVYVPAADQKFDFELDENARVEQVITELGGMLERKLKSPGGSEGQFLLCSMDRQEILATDKTLGQNRVKDGSRLLLV
ncbi:MAG: EsaB/YukD family protein [Lachnospiraceae bacterium]|nr:EsaB/YukD family protein [Lachnospiraceae bacterium]